jgi:hypothetical protein
MLENSSNNKVEDIFDSVDKKNVDRGSRIADPETRNAEPQLEAGNRNAVPVGRQASLDRSLRSDDSPLRSPSFEGQAGRDDKGGKNDFPLRSPSFEGQVGRDDKGGEVEMTSGTGVVQGEGRKKSGIKNIIIIVAIMIGTVIIVGGIVFVVQGFMNRRGEMQKIENAKDQNLNLISNDEVSEDESQESEKAKKQESNNEEESETSIADDDSDGDGLSNSDEVKYKTNLNKVDTDDDGLFDGEEVNFFKTNPINSDTDGDGFLDGEEVRYGFDPNGDGKLLNFEEALEKLKK